MTHLLLRCVRRDYTSRMLLERFRTLVNSLNRIRIWGLADYDLGTALTVPLKEALSQSAVSRTMIFKRLFAAIFIERHYYETYTQPEAKILFFYSHSYVAGGPHHKKLFHKVTSLVGQKDMLVACQQRGECCFGGVALLAYLPIWFVQMRKVELDWKCKFFLLTYLLEVKKWIQSSEKQFCPAKYKLLVTFCDAHVTDNIMTQYFKNAGIATATLQHGWYRETKQGADSFSDIELGFEGLVSDKFLAWGEYIETSAIRSGVGRHKIVCLGSPHFIDYECTEASGVSNYFGLVLGRSEGHCKQENQIPALAHAGNQIDGRTSLPAGRM